MDLRLRLGLCADEKRCNCPHDHEKTSPSAHFSSCTCIVLARNLISRSGFKTEVQHRAQ